MNETLTQRLRKESTQEGIIRISEGVYATDYLATIAEMYEQLKYVLINHETLRTPLFRMKRRLELLCETM